MHVIYRITDIPSTQEPPLFKDDKLALNKLCLQSFLNAFISINCQITFICDNCSEETLAMIRNSVKFPYTIVTTYQGIDDSMKNAYRIARELDDQVLFQECDYLYNGVVGKRFTAAIAELGLVSPYDHPNFYKDKNLHSDICEIKLVGSTHYRSTERNTMTWGCHSSLIRQNYDLLCQYGYLDSDVWADLKKRGHELWVPIPSFATHMVKDWLAPSIKWEEVWQDIL